MAPSGTTPPRRCAATNAAGTPCRARPLRQSAYCLAHDQEARASASFGGAEAGSLGGRPRKPTATEVEREELATLVRPHLRQAVEALARILRNGESEAAVVAASRELLDRGYGKAVGHDNVTITGTLSLEQLYASSPNQATDTPLGQDDA